MSLAILGSGSAGNCSLLTLNTSADEAVHVLIDAGLSPRETACRLGAFSRSIDDISDILVTHFDTDHFHPGWRAKLQTAAISVHAHRRHRNPAGRAMLPRGVLHLYDDGPALSRSAATSIESLLLAHDDLGTVGFVIEHGGARLGFATDLGRVPLSLHERFVNLDALALESNYDGPMQAGSARPAFLKRRIMGGAGHLSNEQALDAVRSIASRSALQHIALLHLSRQCNCPRLVRSLYEAHARHLLDRLTITTQHQPTSQLRIVAARTRAPDVQQITQPGQQHALF